MQKKCCTCGVIKHTDDFNKNQDRCRLCCKEWYRENKPHHIKMVAKNKAIRREETRNYVYSYLLSHPCVDCGESDPIVLQFDHVRGEKKENVSVMVLGGATIQRVQREIDKCEVRCANCHTRRTAFEAGWWITKQAV